MFVQKSENFLSDKRNAKGQFVNWIRLCSKCHEEYDKKRN